MTQQLIDLVRLRDEEHKGWTEIGDILGMTRDQVRRQYPRAKAAQRGEAEPEPTAHVVFKPGRKLRVATWARKADWSQILDDLKACLLEDIRSEAQAGFPEPPHGGYASSGMLLEVSPFDAHFGKLAWHEETGENFDVKIAEDRWRVAVRDLLGRATKEYQLEKIVLVFGNDMTQTDTFDGTTTSGTYVDTDTRYIRMFRYAARSAAWAVRLAAATGVPVEVVIVPGNHDRMTAFHLGEVLVAMFADDPRVTVDNGPALRKYLEWGVVGIGWTHGSEERQADLPLIMATEQPGMWGRTTWHEWHVGHLHKSKEMRYTAGDSFNGARVRILPALCTADAWHAMRGYVGEQQGVEAYLWHNEAGYCGHYFSNAHHPLLRPVDAA